MPTNMILFLYLNHANSRVKNSNPKLSQVVYTFFYRKENHINKNDKGYSYTSCRRLMKSNNNLSKPISHYSRSNRVSIKSKGTLSGKNHIRINLEPQKMEETERGPSTELFRHCRISVTPQLQALSLIIILVHSFPLHPPQKRKKDGKKRNK